MTASEQTSPQTTMSDEGIVEAESVESHSTDASRYASPRAMEWCYHTAVLASSILTIVASFLMVLDDGGKVYLPGAELPLAQACYSKLFFGVDCPGCGLTRSFLAISSGNLVDAIRFNAAGLVVYSFVVLQLVWQPFQMARMVTGWEPIYSHWLLVPFGVMWIALGIQWLFRLGMG